MANNSSLTIGHGWSHLPFYILYICEGSIIVVGNIIIVISIACYKALRYSKEYTIMLGLSMADSINTAGYFFAGIYRINLLLQSTHHTMKTSWQCITTTHNILWAVGIPLSAMMLAVVSLDRLLCVLFPLRYVGWTVSYARSLVGSAYVFSSLGALYALTSTYGDTTLVAAVCIPESAIETTTHPLYSWYFGHMPPLYAVISVFTYAFVAVLYKRMNTVVFSEHPNQQYELKRQRKVTITLSISALCTLFLYVVPYSTAISFYERGYYNIAIVLWCTANLNGLMNVFIYPLRHSEMKQAIRAMFVCKHMPEDLKLWKAQALHEAEAKRNSAPKYVARGARVVDHYV